MLIVPSSQIPAVPGLMSDNSCQFDFFTYPVKLPANLKQKKPKDMTGVIEPRFKPLKFRDSFEGSGAL